MSNYLKNIRTAPLKAVAARVMEFLPKDSISIDKLEEWAYQSYESIAPREIYEVRFSYIPIHENQGSLPLGIFYLEMVLYRAYRQDRATRTSPYVNEETEFTTTTDVNTGTTNDTTTKTTITTDVYERNVKLTGADIEVYNQDVYGNLTKEQLYYHTKPLASGWAPLRLATNVFHNSVTLNTPHDVYSNCNEAFSVQNGCIITTFSEGEVMIAYTGLPTNDEGEYVYADFEYVSAALEAALFKNYWKWKMNTGNVNGAVQKYQMFAQEYELLSAKATGNLMMPDLIQYQNIHNMNKFFKEDSPFATVMGALNNTETLHFNNPSRGRGVFHGLNINTLR